MAFGNVSLPAVTVTTSLTELCNLDVRDIFSAGFVIENTGAVAFNAFEVSVQGHQDESTWTVIASAAGDFSTAVYPILRALGAPVTLAGPGKALVLMSVSELARVRIRASVASTTTTALVRVSGK